MRQIDAGNRRTKNTKINDIKGTFGDTRLAKRGKQKFVTQVLVPYYWAEGRFGFQGRWRNEQGGKFLKAANQNIVTQLFGKIEGAK
jgi:hypothetical protein